MKENRIVANNGSSIVFYTTEDGNTQLEVKLEKDNVWLNREQIAQLYGRDYKTIAKHINNALREELEGESVVAKFATPKKYGRKEGYTQMQNIDYYNLDMIISVGYRVKSRNGIVFRKWANNILKQYLIKGYAIDQRRLDHYDELKDVVRLMSRALTLQTRSQRVNIMLFLWFMEKNGILYSADGRKRIADNTLVALTLMIAESRTEEKDVMVKVVVNLINKDNQ